MTQRRSRTPRGKSTRASHGIAKIPAAAERRKLIAFDADTWRAVDQLARDRMMSMQELAEEAFADLLSKHRRPTDLRRALRASADSAAERRRS